MSEAKANERRKYVKKQVIAERYSISLRSVDELCKKKILPKMRIGGIVRFDVEACDAAMKRQEQGALEYQI